MQLLYKLAVLLVLSTAVSKALKQGKLIRYIYLAKLRFMHVTIETGTVIGELPDLAGHQIQGTLIALDENTLFIRNFHFDGQGPGMSVQYWYVYIKLDS